jgi:hypothetical protein
MVNGQRPFLLGEFPFGNSAIVLLCVSCNTKPRTPKLRLHATCLPLTSGAYDATSPSGFRGSRIHHVKFPWCRKPRNAEPRYARFDATRPSVDRRLPLLRKIATRDFTGHKTLVSQNSERRNPEALDSCHLSSYDRRLWSNREIALRDFEECKPLAL